MADHDPLMTASGDDLLREVERLNTKRSSGSLRRRMFGVAAAWIAVMLLGGGLALDRVLTVAITRNFDDNQQYVLTSMIAAAEIDEGGEVRLNRPRGG